MKHTYIAPEIEIINLDAEEMMKQIRASFNVKEYEKVTNGTIGELTPGEGYIGIGIGGGTGVLAGRRCTVVIHR